MSVSVIKKEKSTSPKPRKKASGKLTADDWIKAAEKILAEHGIDAVRVEPLAKTLKVTKGSFYWHFKDRYALLQAMLNDWRKRSTNAIIGRLDSKQMTPKERLRGLLELHKRDGKDRGGASFEMAIRQWAKSDALANDALTEIDQHRFRYIAGIYLELGFDSHAANSRAFLLYSTMMGVAYLPNLHSDDLIEECEKILLKDTPFE